MNQPSLLEAQKELLSSTFGQAQAYTNVVLVAGYAGFFGIWSFVRDDLSRGTMFISALLITISLGFFVLWEVAGMIMRNNVLTSLATVVADEAKFAEGLAAYKRKRQEQNTFDTHLAGCPCRHNFDSRGRLLHSSGSFYSRYLDQLLWALTSAG